MKRATFPKGHGTRRRLLVLLTLLLLLCRGLVIPRPNSWMWMHVQGQHLDLDACPGATPCFDCLHSCHSLLIFWLDPHLRYRCLVDIRGCSTTSHSSPLHATAVTAPIANVATTSITIITTTDTQLEIIVSHILFFIKSLYLNKRRQSSHYFKCEYANTKGWSYTAEL